MFTNELTSFSIRRTSLFSYLLLFPILIFYSLFAHFLQNIPYIDDFYWYFNFIDNFDKAATISSKLNVFLESYNSHRHYVQRAIILLFVWLTGEVNISFFIVVGNLYLLALLYTIWTQTSRTVSGFVFLAWLFFQPISFINYYTFAFFNLPVLLFAWLFLRLQVKQVALQWVIFIGLLATFSNGNGLLVWLLGMIIAFMQTNYKRVATFGFILAALGILFSLQQTRADPNPTGKTYSVSYLLDALLYFDQLHASFIDWSTYHLSWLTPFVGIALLILLGSLIFKVRAGYQKIKEPVLFFYLLFLSSSMALISVGRASVEGTTALVVDHYKLYPCLFLGCIVYYGSITNVFSKRLSIFLTVAAMLITGTNYYVYLPRMYNHFNRQLADALNFKATGKWLFYPPIQGKKEYDFVNAVSASVVGKKRYTPFSPTVHSEKTNLVAQQDSNSSSVTLRVQKTRYFPFSEEAFLLVYCRDKTYYFPAVFERSWKDLLKWRIQQNTATATINWTTMHEPCTGQPQAIRFAVLSNNDLSSFPVVVEQGSRER